MSDRINEAGLEAARLTLWDQSEVEIAPTPSNIETTRQQARNIIAAYLSAMTPTDNLEAGAGDLVERLRALAKDFDAEVTDATGEDPVLWDGFVEVKASTIREAAARLAALTAERDMLSARAIGWEHNWQYERDLKLEAMAQADTVTAENARLREALTDIRSAADSFRDECGDEVAGQVILRVDAAISQEAPK